MTITSWGKTYKVRPNINRYRNNKNLAIELTYWDEEIECELPYASLTVNILKMPSPMAAVDTNNCPWAEDFIERYGLGTPTAHKVTSGYCQYPIYKFDLEKVAEYEKEEL